MTLLSKLIEREQTRRTLRTLPETHDMARQLRHRTLARMWGSLFGSR